MSAVDRRSFFKRGAAVVAAAPFAIQSQLKELAAAGTSTIGYGGSIPTGYSGYNKLSKLMRLGQIPEWRAAEIRREAKQSSYRLDPDLIANRSLSLSARVLIQEQRNFNLIAKSEGQWSLINEARNAFFGENS